MASFLDCDDRERRRYVARMMNLDPTRPYNWPIDVIDRVFHAAEEAAEATVRSEVRKLAATIIHR